MMFSSQSPQENGRSQEDLVTITDDQGRSLDCMIRSIVHIEERDYLVLIPVDAPVEILRWPDEDDEDETPIPIESEAELDEIFPIAKAVLEEQNLTLKRTAITLTVAGDLEIDEDELEDRGDDSEGEDDYEEMIELRIFYSDEQEYGIYTPIEPFFLLASRNERGEPQLLSGEELDQIEPFIPMIEEQLFDDDLD